MKCKFCGTKLNKKDHKCPKCGRNAYGAKGKGASNRKRKLLFIGGILLASLIVCTLMILVLNNTVNNNRIDSTMIDSANKEFMMTNVPADYEIKINSNDSNYKFSVEDIINETVVVEAGGVQGNITIHPPAGGYEKGEIYSCDLKGHGTFENKECFGAEKITFVIEKKKTLDITYTDKVIELPYGKADISGKNITIEGEYRTNDIILTDTDGDNIQEIYKLCNAKTNRGYTVASFKEPREDEVYKNIDIFFDDNIDMAEVEVDEESLEGRLVETGIMDAFIDSAYAGQKAKIKVKKKKDGLSCEFDITVEDPNDKSRTLKISCTLADEMLYIKKGKKVQLQNTVHIKDGVEFSVKGEAKADTEKAIKKALKKYTAEKTNSTQNEYEIPIIPFKIPIVGPIYAKFEVGIKGELKLGGQFSMGLDMGVKLQTGAIYDCKKSKVIKKYAGIETEMDSYILLKGEAEAFAGVYVEAGVVIPILVTVEIDGEAGPYIEAEGCMIIEGIPDDLDIKGKYKVAVGVKCSVDLCVELLKEKEVDVEILNKKKILWEKDGDVFNKKTSNDKRDEKITNFDPLDFFKTINEIGHTYSSIDSKYKLTNEQQTDSWHLLESSNGIFSFEFYSTGLTEPYMDGTPGEPWILLDSDICDRMSGPAEYMMGISEPISLSEFLDSTGLFHERNGEFYSLELVNGPLDGLFINTSKEDSLGYGYTIFLDDVTAYDTKIYPDTNVYIYMREHNDEYYDWTKGY